MMTYVDRVRQCIESSDWPLGIKDWTKSLSYDTNCFAFALGLNFPDGNYNIFVPPDDVYIVDYLEHFLEISGLLYRKISSIDEAKKDEIIIQVHENKKSGDFHVIRRNLDGKWVQKEGWINILNEITNWDYIKHTYPVCVATFAVKKRTS